MVWCTRPKKYGLVREFVSSSVVTQGYYMYISVAAVFRIMIAIQHLPIVCYTYYQYQTSVWWQSSDRAHKVCVTIIANASLGWNQFLLLIYTK